MKRTIAFFSLAVFLSSPAAAQSAPEDNDEVEVVVTAPRVSERNPSSTYRNVASDLAYEPLVDLQSRNLAEAQGDLSIRGGTFENSGVRIGGVNLFDPQTGHYLLELPFDPHMFTKPSIAVGSANAISGFNASVGTAGYEFSTITRDTLDMRVGWGSRNTFVEDAYGAGVFELGEGNGTIGADLSVSHSSSDGSRDDGDSVFSRLAGRLQLKTAESQTDIAFGYQHKRFSWPYLYALQELHNLVGSSGIEQERLNTEQLLVNHHHDITRQTFFDIGFTYRKHRDDYDFDRFNPDLFNAFRHVSRYTSLGGQGEVGMASFGSSKVALALGAQIAGDDIDSTALTFGDFSSRMYRKVSAVPVVRVKLSEDWNAEARAGASFDDTNRDDSRVSPVSLVAFDHKSEGGGSERFFASVSQASQVASYTALNSNSAAGLFRGNQDLERTISSNYEVGASIERDRWRAQSAMFYRYDKDLVDWTYQNNVTPFAARSAENLDIGTYGVESLVQLKEESMKVTVGHTYLTKDEDYGVEAVDASFYALNYARHRFTGSVIYHVTEEIAFNYDLEVRRQIPNSLRSSTNSTFAIGSVGVSWQPQELRGLVLGGSVENLWKENFEEVPGVPGIGRLALVEAGFRW